MLVNASRVLSKQKMLKPTLVSFYSTTTSSSSTIRPFSKILVANRGEIAIRIFRAAHELNIPSVAVFHPFDNKTAHRWKADESYVIGKENKLGPVEAYLSHDEIIRVCLETGADAVHPGYGFLSENDAFAKKLQENGIKFIGPRYETISSLGEKVSGRELATKAGVPVIPGSGALNEVEDARAFGEQHGYPLILKAARGGGGRGMRVVNSADELEEGFSRCRSEAISFFGDGTMFAERFLANPQHVEVQILADEHGNVVHLFERDCSVQRRHQKVIEFAPSVNLSDEMRQRLANDAVALAKEAGYANAGTFEFLVEPETNSHYFLEVNPRIQVEHPVTEVLTGIDLVQSQIRIAQGEDLFSTLSIKSQDDIKANGYALQCRITTEDSTKNFQPDSGKLTVYRSPGGAGVRLDGGNTFAGAEITPHYDSLLTKLICSGSSWAQTIARTERALREFRIRGVSTNIPFVMNVLGNEQFRQGRIHTNLVDKHPELFVPQMGQNRANRMLDYFGDVAVNGPSLVGMNPRNHRSARANIPSEPVVPKIPSQQTETEPISVKLRRIFVEQGPEAFAKEVRATKQVLFTDTTSRDAHQSLLATRVRTRDLLRIAPLTRQVMKHHAFSLENWGGATFDVALRFLHECPWQRLEKLREEIPDIPFQMLLRGANAVGYTSYPDNVVFRFCKQAVKSGMDVFRIFDSLNYVDNLRLGIDAVGEAGGIVEAAISYTGNLDPNSKYNLDYYLKLANEITSKSQIHVLCIKDMAGLLTPYTAYTLVSALRKEHPDLPIHVHTHDSVGLGVASMQAAIRAGADAVDGAVDSMSGLTSQPSLGALIATAKPPGHKLFDEGLVALSDYWADCRVMYDCFESGQLATDSSVLDSAIPGGQLTNLFVQSRELGLGDFPRVKKAYADANRIFGDIIKVTPSSKVVGDLAQFMVSNNLSAQDVLDQARTLSFPSSVVEFLRGDLGVPVGGFPEPFRTNVLESRSLKPIEGRPGASLEPLDFDALSKRLKEKHGSAFKADEANLLSAALYPSVYDGYMETVKRHGELSSVPTPNFIYGLPEDGSEVTVEIERGKELIVSWDSITKTIDASGNRSLTFSVNSMPRTLRVPDKKALESVVTNRKASADPGSVGAPLQGELLAVRVKEGEVVKAGQALAVLSAMKMETVVTAPFAGKVKSVVLNQGQAVSSGDLILEIEKTE